MIKAIYSLKGQVGSSRELLDLLKVISSRTKFQTGCSQSEVWQIKETSEIMLMESWRSKDDLDSHINSNLFKRLIAALEMSALEPQISYLECEDIRGIDLIEEVLLSKSSV